jgi:hypothetical protein
MLMSHSQGIPPQGCWTKGDGVYISFNFCIWDPDSWSTPEFFVDSFPIGLPPWYPQVIGMGTGETDKIAGEYARVFRAGRSDYIVQFIKE